MSKMRIAKRDRPQVKAECLRLLTTLRLDPGRTRLISGFVDTYLRLNQQEEQAFHVEIGNTDPGGRHGDRHQLDGQDIESWATLAPRA